MNLTSYLFRQHKEIESDPILWRFGWALLSVHFLTALFWYFQDFQSLVTDLNQGLCWPFLPSCDALKLALSPVASFLLPIYFSASVFSMVLVLSKRKLLWPLLLSLEVVKYALSLLDYRFMGNYHFIPHVLTFYFLFFPQKRSWSTFWIFTFYLAAASLKINLEWLSGASLSWKVPFDNPRLLPYLASMGLLTEIIAPQLLYFKNRSTRFMGLALLTSFHAVSYYWVGFFYPSVMACCLSLLFFEIVENKPRIPFNLRDKSLLASGSLWAVFILFQMFSLNDSQLAALDGSKRLLSLNMFDARAQCRGFFTVEDEQGSITEVSFKNYDLAVRVKCDTIVFLEQARKICQTKSAKIRRVGAYLSSMRSSDETPLLIIQEKNICDRWTTH